MSATIVAGSSCGAPRTAVVRAAARARGIRAARSSWDHPRRGSNARREHVATGDSCTHTSPSFPRFLEEGDLVVVNTSGTLASAVNGMTGGGVSVEVHLSTRLPAGLWTLELRRDANPLLDARAGRGRRARGGGADRTAHPLLHERRRCEAVGGDALTCKDRSRAIWRCTEGRSLRIREGIVADHHVPERLLDRARLGRDAERRTAIHP